MTPGQGRTCAMSAMLSAPSGMRHAPPSQTAFGSGAGGRPSSGAEKQSSPNGPRRARSRRRVMPACGARVGRLCWGTWVLFKGAPRVWQTARQPDHQALGSQPLPRLRAVFVNCERSQHVGPRVAGPLVSTTLLGGRRPTPAKRVALSLGDAGDDRHEGEGKGERRAHARATSPNTWSASARSRARALLELHVISRRCPSE